MISASAVAMRHELIMSLVAGLSPIIKVWKPNAQLNIDENPCRDWRGFFLILGGAPRFHSNFTDKEPFLEHLSVSKTHFTD